MDFSDMLLFLLLPTVYAHSGAAKAGFQTGFPKMPLVFHFSEKQLTSQTLHTVALW